MNTNTIPTPAEISALFTGDEKFAAEITETVSKVVAKHDKAAKKAAAKAKKNEAKAIKRAENAEIAPERLRCLLFAACGGVEAGAAVALANPVIGILAANNGVRAVRYGLKWRNAVKARNAVRAGAVIDAEVAREQLLVELGNDAKWEAVQALIDAGAMGHLGFVGKDPVWVALAMLSLVNGGLQGLLVKVTKDMRETDEAPVITVSRKPGAHKLGVPVVVA